MVDPIFIKIKIKITIYVSNFLLKIISTGFSIQNLFGLDYKKCTNNITKNSKISL